MPHGVHKDGALIYCNVLQPLVNKYLLVPASSKIANVQNFLRKKLQLKSDSQVKEILA